MNRQGMVAKSVGSSSRLRAWIQHDESMNRLGRNIPWALAISSRRINIRLSSTICCHDPAHSILDIVTHALPVEVVSEFRGKGGFSEPLNFLINLSLSYH